MSPADKSTPADRKSRWGGVFENPWVSIVIRALVDGGRVARLGRVLRPFAFSSVLEVGCGVGECAPLWGPGYCGLDNSLPSVTFAARRNPHGMFVAGDALRLPFRDAAFDAVLLIDTSHHLTDELLRHVLEEMRRVARRYLVVSDPVRRPGQSAFSRFFYGLDRGACFRTADAMRALLLSAPGLVLEHSARFRTLPGMYVHQAFVLRKDGRTNST